MYSNTKMLEDHFGFTGLLIEPVESFYQSLKANRPKSWCVQCAVSDTPASFVKFIGTNECSGIQSTMNAGASKYVNSRTEYLVPNRSLIDLVRSSKLTYIDVLVVDVEGGEFGVLRSMDWKAIPTFVVFVEAHSTEVAQNEAIAEFMLSQGFLFKERQRGNHVFYNPAYFRKDLFCEIN